MGVILGPALGTVGARLAWSAVRCVTWASHGTCIRRGQEMGPTLHLPMRVHAVLPFHTHTHKNLCLVCNILSFFSRSPIVLRESKRVTNSLIYIANTTKHALHQSSSCYPTFDATPTVKSLPEENVHLLCSSQSIQAPNSTNESKVFRRGLATNFRELSHQSTTELSCSGVSCCQPQRQRNLNQNSRLNTQPARR
jgi:hypothetical protein